MKISNYMNNTNSIMEKNTDKVQKGNSQTNEKHTVGQSVKLSISNEGLEYYRKLTKDEELSNLDAAYKKTVDDFVTMETTNQHARGIIGEEMNKISKITTRSTLASAYIEEQKTRGKDEIPENLTEKMYGAITSFKEKYTMIQPNREQLLMSIKI